MSNITFKFSRHFFLNLKPVIKLNPHKTIKLMALTRLKGHLKFSGFVPLCGLDQVMFLVYKLTIIKQQIMSNNSPPPP